MQFFWGFELDFSAVFYCSLSLYLVILSCDSVQQLGVGGIGFQGRGNRGGGGAMGSNFPQLGSCEQRWKTDRFLVPFRPGALFSVANYPRPGLTP